MESSQGHPNTITRQELYQQVWANPILELAAAYGLSNVGFAKICDRHDVPRPPSGYWRQKEFGKAPKQPPLPPATDPELEVVHLSVRGFRKSEPVPKSEPIPQSLAPEYDAEVLKVLEVARAMRRATVPAAIRDPHPLVAATRQELNAASPDGRHMVHPPRYGGGATLGISVSKASVRRALAYLDTLIKTIEKLDGAVRVQPDPWYPGRHQAVVVFCGETVTLIRLRETYKQVPKKTKPIDWWDSQKCDYVPTARLVIDAGTRGPVYAQDTEAGCQIEDDINRLIIRLVDQVGQSRIQRRKEGEENRRQAEEERVRRERDAELERKRQELRDKQKAENIRVEELLAGAAAWRERQLLREYIRQVERVCASRSGSVAQGSELSQWLTWAYQQADRLDPLSASPPSVLDESC